MEALEQDGVAEQKGRPRRVRMAPCDQRATANQVCLLKCYTRGEFLVALSFVCCCLLMGVFANGTSKEVNVNLRLEIPRRVG